MTGPRQLRRDQLAGMTPEAITRAHRAGQLRDLLSPPAAPPDRQRIADDTAQLRREDLGAMTAAEIVSAGRAGRLHDLGITTLPPRSPH